jgi:prepilin-type processing-associated H-X9-DG protein
MPVHFQFWGQADANKNLAEYDGFASLWVRSVAGDPNWEAVTPSYLSRVDRVGPSPARKVCVADGNRYVEADGSIDFDINPFPTHFGSFASGGAWWSGDTSYGVRGGSTNWGGQAVSRGSASNGQNLRLSYRHLGGREKQNGTCQANGGKINAMFFDGHVDGLSDKQSRKMDLWYPTGTRVKNPSEGMTVVENDYIVQ